MAIFAGVLLELVPKLLINIMPAAEKTVSTQADFDVKLAELDKTLAEAFESV